MNKAERLEDIRNRYTLALAERNILEPGTENYNILSEVARKILTEYQNRKRSQRESAMVFGYMAINTNL